MLSEKRKELISLSRRGENIRKRKDGRWEGRYRVPLVDGGSVCRSVYAKSYREVREKLHSAKDAERAECRREDEPTVAALLDMWQRENATRLKRGSVTKYENLITSHILPSLGTLRLSQVTSQRINAFISEKLRCGRLDGTGGLSRSYVRSISLVISSAMKYAVREGLCRPMTGTVTKPSLEKCKPTVLSIDEQKRLELALRGRLDPTSVGIMLSLYMGLRVGEVCALAWDDVDLEKSVLEVRHTLSSVFARDTARKTELILDEPKSPSSRRQIPIPSTLFEMLRRRRESSRGEFVVSDGESFVSVRTYEARWRRTADACGLAHVNYHALRHTFATRCIEAGMDAKSLSELLGHAGVSVTLNTYVHPSLELKRSQLEKLEPII